MQRVGKRPADLPQTFHVFLKDLNQDLLRRTVWSGVRVFFHAQELPVPLRLEVDSSGFSARPISRERPPDELPAA